MTSSVDLTIGFCNTLLVFTGIEPLSGFIFPTELL